MKLIYNSLHSYNIWGWLVLLAAVSLYSSIYFIRLPMVPIVLCIFIMNLVIMNHRTRGIALLLFSSMTLGTVFQLYHIPIPAYVFTLSIALWSLRREIKTCKFNNRALANLLLVFLIFIIWFLMGPAHAYSQSKLIYILCLGTSSLIGWNIIMQTSKIEYLKLALFLGVNALVFISIAYDFYQFPSPNGFFDFNFFRSFYTTMSRKDTSFVLTYHSVGIPAMLGIAMLISHRNIRVLSPSFLVTFVFLLFLLFISQTRQAILGLVLIVPLRIFISSKISLFVKILLSVGIFIIMFYGLSTMESDAIQKTLHSHDRTEMVNRDYDEAMSKIKSNVFLGSGLGGYSLSGNREYPHNLFLELLCETGVLGTILLSILIFLPAFKNISNVGICSNSHQYIILVVIALGVRSMASSDLMESISFITLVLVFFSYKVNRIEK